MERLLARDRDAVSEALNRIDDARPGQREKALELLGALERAARFPGPPRVGVTGAPGAGKSSLLDAIVRTLRASGETLGIVAVDPSSRRTGGALLGDRIRVRSGASDPGVFFRSMAARERLGGVADATRPGVTVLAAAFDWVFVETVGVGQSETDVATLVDTLVYVAQPGAGDLLQFMKAGILEVPDVFVVNKADLGAAAARTAGELAAGLGLGSRDTASGWTPPILLVSARDGTGISELVEALRAHRRQLESSGTLEARRARGKEVFVQETLERRYGSYGTALLSGSAGIACRVREARDASAFALVLALGREIEDALRKPLP
ncbi:MAG TPA: methylmalonyl Co-A mutase-associated GTPase MeaB [Myxococcota bacterium]|nr:methylmalonyl Co-A mutase-associated GTPase MeaB [Myxococcota bacterium]